MRLSDIMGNLHLSLFPQVALVIFLGVFGLVALRVLTTPRRETEMCARLPLDDDEQGSLE